MQEVKEAERKKNQQNRDRSPEEKKRRYSEMGGRDRQRDRGAAIPPPGASTPSGFGRRPGGLGDYSDEEDDGGKYGRKGSSARDKDDRGGRRMGASSGAAIAPPPSLNEDTPSNPPSGSSESLTAKLGSKLANPGLGVAAKIMARYGYQEGKGLGKDEQGMSQALSVEKTSKRGGRIVHEKDSFVPPPPVGAAAFGGPPPVPSSEQQMTPPQRGEYGDAPGTPPPAASEQQDKPSITDLMKNPGKVVLCKNMVGPGEVDDELQPEVQEECSNKYGDVTKVVIFELPNAPSPEEAVRIFIEFRRVESAIKGEKEF